MQGNELVTRTDFEDTAALRRQKVFTYALHDMIFYLLSFMCELTQYTSICGCL